MIRGVLWTDSDAEEDIARYKFNYRTTARPPDGSLPRQRRGTRRLRRPSPRADQSTPVGGAKVSRLGPLPQPAEPPTSCPSLSLPISVSLPRGSLHLVPRRRVWHARVSLLTVDNVATAAGPGGRRPTFRNFQRTACIALPQRGARGPHTAQSAPPVPQPWTPRLSDPPPALLCPGLRY